MTFENVADNLRESFRVVAGSRGHGEIRELPGVSIAAAGATFQMFNTAFLSSPVITEAELERRVFLASLHFDARGMEWSYWVCHDWIEARARKRVRRILESNGMRFSVELPGMVAECLAAPRRPLPRIEFRRVGDASTRAAFCAIGSTCFFVPLVWFKEVFDNDLVWERFVSYVGYLDGEPIATAAVVAGGDALGVYNVATLPEYQHRGYGEAVMRHALAQARALFGIERSVLQSTPAGLKLYERMGYRAVTRVSVYAS